MLETLTLQFSTSTAWQSKVIRKLCHSPFSHVDVVLPDGNLLGASDSPSAPSLLGNPRGVAVRPPNYQLFGMRRNAVFRTNLAEDIVNSVMTQLGKPFESESLYSFLDDQIADRNWRDPERWFCSELVTWGFENAGYWLPDELIWPKSRVSPTDLLLMFMWDRNFINRKEFWEPIKGIELGDAEV